MLGCMLWRSSAVTHINILVIWKLLCHFKNISVVIYVHILVLLIEWCTLLYHLYVCTCTKRSSKIWDHASRNFLKRHVNMCATFTLYDLIQQMWNYCLFLHGDNWKQYCCSVYIQAPLLTKIRLYKQFFRPGSYSSYIHLVAALVNLFCT